MKSKASGSSELCAVGNMLLRGFIAAGYELVAGEQDLYCIKPGRAVVQFVNCSMAAGGGLFCDRDKLVIMQGCTKLLEYK